MKSKNEQRMSAEEIKEKETCKNCGKKWNVLEEKMLIEKSEPKLVCMMRPKKRKTPKGKVRVIENFGI